MKKLFLAIELIALFIILIFGIGMTSHAAENDTTEPQETTNVEPTEPQEENSYLIDLIQNLKQEDVELAITGLIAYLVANFGTVLVLVIVMIKKKLKELKTSEFYQALQAKSSQEQQARQDAFMENVVGLLDKQYTLIIGKMNDLDDAKKQEALQATADVKKALSEINISLSDEKE